MWAPFIYIKASCNFGGLHSMSNSPRCKERKEKTNVEQSDVNVNMLAMTCSRIPLVQGGA